MILGATLPLTGCAQLLGGLIIADHHARVTARGQGNNNITCMPFIGSDFKDSNGDGFLDPRTEIVNKGRTTFYVGEEFVFGATQQNCQGKTFGIYVKYNGTGDERIIDTRILQLSNSSPHSSISFDSPTSVYLYFTLDRNAMGGYNVEIMER